MEINMIHQTAIVSPDATIGEGVNIGAYSIIGEDVTIGKGTWIGPHVVVDPHVSIGPGCRIFQFAAIGAIPQDLKFGGEKSYLPSGNLLPFIGEQSRVVGLRRWVKILF